MSTFLRPTSAIAVTGAVLASLVVGTAPAQAERPDRPAAVLGVSEWVADAASPTLPEGTWSAVEVARDATYGLTGDGRVVSAVDRGKEVLRAPAFTEPITDVAAGSDFGLALDEDGHVERWGSAAWSIPAQDLSATYRDVAAAGSTALGITSDGKLRRWGPGGQALNPLELLDLVGLDLAAVQTDGLAVTVLTTTGKIVSLGSVLRGLGGGKSFPLSRLGEKFTAVDVTDGTAVALTQAGEIVAWGRNGAGQADVPQLPAGLKAVAVSAGGAVSGAVLSDGSLLTWGDDDLLPTFDVPDGAQLLDLDLDRLRAAVTYAAMAAQGPVTLSGTPTVGVPLTAQVGWVDQPTDLTYTWKVGDVVRSTAASYTPTGADADKPLTVTIRGTRLGLAPGSATSAPEQVRPGVLDAPLVRVLGTPRVGQALTARAADDTDATGGGYRWLRDGTTIAGATRSRYTPVAADLGRRLSVVRTSTAPGYGDAEATSPATAAVAPGAARLKVTAPARAVRGRTVTVLVRGLARGERFTVTLGPRKVRGTATGRAQEVRVPVAAKPGKRRLTVVGAYADRRGTDTLRVARRR